MRNFTDGQILTAEDINTHLLNRDAEARVEGQQYLDELKSFREKFSTARKLLHSSSGTYAGLRRFNFVESTREAFNAETDSNLYASSFDGEPYRCETDLKTVHFGIVGSASVGKIRIFINEDTISYGASEKGWKYYGRFHSYYVGRVKGKIVVWVFSSRDSEWRLHSREGDSEIPFYCIGEKA